MKNFFQYIAIIALTLVGCELISFGAVLSLSGPETPYLQEQVARFHPLWRSSTRETTGNPVAPYRASDERNPFTFSTRMGYAIKPDHWFSHALRTNAQGFVCNATCEDLPRVKPADEFRVFVFGGSTIASNGTEKSGADTIPGQLERILNEKNIVPGKRVRVVNAGVSGYFSGQEVARLVNEVFYYDADLIVFFDGNNDWVEWNYSSFYFDIGNYKKYIGNTTSSYDYTVMDALDRVSNPFGATLIALNLINDRYPVFHYTTTLVKYLRLRVQQRGLEAKSQGGDAAVEEKLSGEALNALMWRRDAPSLGTWKSSLDVAEGAARRKGVKALFCLQPALRDPGMKTALSEREAEMVAGAQKKRNFYFADYYAAAKKEIYSPRITKNDGDVRYCDLTALFKDETGPVYTDEIHYFVPALGRIADALADQIVPLTR